MNGLNELAPFADVGDGIFSDSASRAKSLAQLPQLLFPASQQAEFGAAPGQFLREGPANAAGRASDDDHLILKSHSMHLAANRRSGHGVFLICTPYMSFCTFS